MKSFLFALPVFSLCKLSLSSPVPAPAAQAAASGCSDINLSGVTSNDIVNGVCKDFTLIFARGTGESGNIGDLVGPPFVAALKAKIGASKVAVQGVNDYPADIPGFLAGGSSTGSANMASLIEETMTKCPKTKLCVSGYSQGAQVAHNAAKLLSSKASAFINSVVLFGDPDDGSAFGQVSASEVSTDCHVGDEICAHTIFVLPPHLDYCLDATTEANFAASKAGL